MSSKPKFAPIQTVWVFTAAALLPLVAITGIALGSWWMALVPIYAWFVMPALDRALGQNAANPDPNSTQSLSAHSWLTLAWVPIQFCLIFGVIYWLGNSTTHSTAHQIIAMILIGTCTGAVGIVFAHELMHQAPRHERLAGDLLMAMALYGHFRTEHLLVHHTYVGTPKDAVTARYNEGFHRFFPRVLIGCLRSAWDAEKTRLQKRGKSVWDLKNPFYIYAGLQLKFLIFAFVLAGSWGVALFIIQAFIAILYLELINYIEHYGLTREHLGNGKYEHTKPHHSWNSDHSFTNWAFINLQRHSDHHYKPNRRYPLLQTYSEDAAPMMPFGYPIMALLASNPPLFKRVMNPRVRAWRKAHYPHITDWYAYNKGLNPLPQR